MLPTSRNKLHVRSSRLLVDGALVAGVVDLELGARGGTVTALWPGRDASDAIDVGDLLIAPAPLDLHFHGCAGTVVPPGGDPGDIDQALQIASRDTGWSHPLALPAYEWIATLPIPERPPADPVEQLAAAARSIAAQRNGWCAGVRVEGLFLNPARAGVWPPESFRLPDPVLLEELHAAAGSAGSQLRIIDIAPELPGAVSLIGRARELGVVASLAHSDATWEQARRAIDAGATLATHTWNAMRPVLHRDPGIVAATLADPRVTCELICDGVHLHPGTIALSTAACGRGRWLAVSDASPFAGRPPGTYEWAGTTVTHDGSCLRDQAGHLAGSASLLDVAPGVLREIGLDEIDVAMALGAVPRRVLDPTRGLGLHVGDPAWIVDLSQYEQRA